MVLASELLPPHVGLDTTAPPQKSEVVPQKPKAEQHTLSGQVEAFDHWMPQPGSHSAFQEHSDVQPSPQKSGPPPQTPLPVSSLDFWSVNVEISTFKNEHHK